MEQKHFRLCLALLGRQFVRLFLGKIGDDDWIESLPYSELITENRT